MKTQGFVLALFAMLCIHTACNKNGDKPAAGPSCVGEWQLTNVAVKSVTYAGQEVDVYVAFQEGGSFELYQMVGQGRYRKYTGTWNLDGTMLSGKYSSKKDWGSSYEVSLKDDNLVLTSSVSGEVSTYRKVSIPESIKSAAYQEK